MRRRLLAFKADVRGGFAFEELSVLRTVGEGGFSRVRLVTSAAHEGGVYALKCCHKARLEKLKQARLGHAPHLIPHHTLSPRLPR